MESGSGILMENRAGVRARALTGSAMLAAIGVLLSYLEFAMPFTPAFAKMDFSDLPALIAAFAFGPFSGVFVALIKNMIHLTSTATGGIGELANFLIGAAFVFPAGLIYRRHKSRTRAILGMAVGTFSMAVVAAVLNYTLLLPLYSAFMPMDQLIGLFQEFIPFIETRLDVCLYSAFPTTFFKGVLISLLTLCLYKRISPLLKGRF